MRSFYFPVAQILSLAILRSQSCVKDKGKQTDFDMVLDLLKLVAHDLKFLETNLNISCVAMARPNSTKKMSDRGNPCLQLTWQLYLHR